MRIDQAVHFRELSRVILTGLKNHNVKHPSGDGATHPSDIIDNREVGGVDGLLNT